MHEYMIMLGYSTTIVILSYYSAKHCKHFELPPLQ
jgi:hypothetical protein